MLSSFYHKYLLPGLVFQGIVIGGGYATGRELVEFFLPHGPIGGLLAMAFAALIWSCVMAVSFEICRMTKSYDYKTFFKNLLGPFWFFYEILLVVLMIIILAVIGSAAGEIFHNIFSAQALFGTIGLLIAVGILSFFGSIIIEEFMGLWSIFMYVCYFSLVVLCLFAFGDDIKSNYAAATVSSGWALDGLRYAGYNLAVVPMVFFSLTHITKRNEAVLSGLIAGMIGMSPAVFLFVAMMGKYPEIGQATIPSGELLGYLDMPWFAIIFQVVLMGTLVQTGVGLVHAVNERIAATLHSRGKEMPELARPVIAVSLLLFALFLASGFGLVSLIANGYGMLTFGFIAVFVLPVLTVGFYKIIKRSF